MAKLWTSSSSQDPEDRNNILERFCFARDVRLDARLVDYDILGSLGHSLMLKKIGILSAEECKVIHQNLLRLGQEFKEGKWSIATEDEDVHTALESRLGAEGEKLHTARSRNDQVLTDMRLYSKDRLLDIGLLASKIALLFCQAAQRLEFEPLPGYTHLQRAMPCSFGMWLGSFAEHAQDVLRELDTAYQLADQCPLGSAAGYGVSLNLDREYTAQVLGFARVQKNSLYCQNSRGYVESVILGALSSLTGLASRFASDVCLYCSEEFGFLKLPNTYFTGSSIMPQKKNPDLFELMRAKVQTLISLEARVRGLTHGLSSGYSKDLQEIKEPVMEAFEHCSETLEVLVLVLPELEPRKERTTKAMTPELFAAERAYELVREGVSFRQAYHQVKTELPLLAERDPAESVKSSTHTGSTGNLKLAQTLEELKSLQNFWQQRTDELHQIWNQLRASTLS